MVEFLSESLYWACGILPLVASIAVWIVIRNLTRERPLTRGKRIWRAAYRVGGASLLFCAAVLLWCAIGTALARLWRSSVAADSKVLVRAIDAYRAEHDGYPSSLDQLVPQYLGVLPTTSLPPWGFLDPRAFEYHAWGAAAEARYELSVDRFGYDPGTAEWAFDDRSWLLPR